MAQSATEQLEQVRDDIAEHRETVDEQFNRINDRLDAIEAFVARVTARFGPSLE